MSELASGGADRQNILPINKVARESPEQTVNLTIAPFYQVDAWGVAIGLP